MSDLEIKQEEMKEETVQPVSVYLNKYPESKIASIKKKSFLLLALMTILFGMIGTYPCSLMGDFSIMLSWIIYFIPLVFAWIGLISFNKCKVEMSEKQYKKGIVRLNNSGMGVMIFSAFFLFICVYYLFSNEYESFITEFGLVVRGLILCVSSVMFALIYRKQHDQVTEVQK